MRCLSAPSRRLSSKSTHERRSGTTLIVERAETLVQSGTESGGRERAAESPVRDDREPRIARERGRGVGDDRCDLGGGNRPRLNTTVLDLYVKFEPRSECAIDVFESFRDDRLHVKACDRTIPAGGQDPNGRGDLEGDARNVRSSAPQRVEEPL